MSLRLDPGEAFPQKEVTSAYGIAHYCRYYACPFTGTLGSGHSREVAALSRTGGHFTASGERLTKRGEALDIAIKEARSRNAHSKIDLAGDNMLSHCNLAQRYI
jgi:hypothetical protein